MTYLQISEITKTFGKFTALQDISLEVAQSEFICLLGPSGCGKTTLLRVIAGLETQDSGRIYQDGKEITRLSASKRDFGIVFQSYALFPNLTAAQNIAFGLQNTGLKRGIVRDRVQELLELVSLSGMGQKFPAQLSGGQQQRVSLARAIALSPGLLLLDEPLSALDAQVRASLRQEIRSLQKRVGITTVMVTHDQVEALTMADRIVVMNKGEIEQVGTPIQIYCEPKTPFVANFIGSMNFLPALVTDRAHRFSCCDRIFEIPQKIPQNGHESKLLKGNPVSLAIRPEDIQILTSSNSVDAVNVLETQLASIEYMGSVHRLSLSLAGESKLIADLSADVARSLELSVGMSIKTHLPADSIRLFDRS
jgi:iron(III) transport system ATP-binding protein